MKLISLYISSFGKFNNYSYDFNQKLNSIYEENGWGKTTMTVFIKAMLYGLNDRTERAKYTPWNNLTSFGGSLVIEVGDNKYRIERQFSPQKASLDSFKIFDLKTNLELNKFGSNVGEIFLNLNDKSFERSVFIPQKELYDEGFGSDIEAKLANLIGGTNDSQTYDEAQEILTNRLKELKMNSKKGLIIEKKAYLQSLDFDIDECNNKIDGIKQIEESIQNLNKNLSDLQEQKRDANKKIIDFHHLQDKLAMQGIAKTYLEDIENTKRQLEENNQIFNGHKVTQEEVLGIRSKNKELLNLKTTYEIKNQYTNVETRLNDLKNQINFKDDNPPTDEEIHDISKAVEKYQSIKSLEHANTQSQTKIEKKKNTTPILLVIVSLLLAIGGISLIIISAFTKGSQEVDTKSPDLKNSLLIIGIVLVVIGALGILGSLALFVYNFQKNQAIEIPYAKVKNYDFELHQIEEKLREFFGKYHLYSSDFSNNLYIIRINTQRYREIKDEYENANKTNDEIMSKIKDIEKLVLDFLAQFQTTALTVEEKIGELNTHLRRQREIENLLIQKQTRYNQYVLLNKLGDIKEVDVDIEALNKLVTAIDDKIQAINNEKTTLSNKIVEFETDIDKLDSLNEKRSEIVEEINQLENEYNTIKLTSDFLKESQTKLLEKYVKPMRDSVNKYVSLFFKNNDYNIDINFKFQFITENGIKELDSYSRGLQTIINLCMRLALIDCLYPNEKPFVILDDPFVNFDDSKLELSKNLIKSISDKYQIVYYTCHESREIK